MLYLFDIDGTLVDTGGAGMAALNAATREIFGTDGPPLDLAGSTDLGIVLGVHAHFSVDPTPQRIASYLDTYQEILDRNLSSGAYSGRVFPGVFDLLETLHHRPGATIGLLTGNIAGGAASKIRHYGLASYFPFGAYGSDHHDRNRLGPIALERASAHAGRQFSPEQTWVIGDTPKDIACAMAIGANCLAVSTGQFTSEQLSAHGAEHIVESLDQAIAWI